MKHTAVIRRLTNVILLGSMLILGGCTKAQAKTLTDPDAASVSVHAEDASACTETAEGSGTAAVEAISVFEEQEEVLEYEVSEDTETVSSSVIPWSYAFTIDDVPEWNGEEAYAVVNDNNPFFPEDYYTDISFETYPELDDLGRCQSVCANIGSDLMPTESRSSISEVTPSGWNQKEYPTDLVPTGWLMNRSHLIGFQLTSEGVNVSNLISGTRYLNTAMIQFENMVADYIKESGNHVLYRATPLFIDDNLLASGVLLEARSVEDNGEAVCFCVYCYNVQPGITIDYLTGDSWANDPENELEDEAVSETDSVPDPAILESDSCCDHADTLDCWYILNTSTHKIHDPECGSVATMIDENKLSSHSTLEELQGDGYTLCSRCLGN